MEDEGVDEDCAGLTVEQETKKKKKKSKKKTNVINASNAIKFHESRRNLIKVSHSLTKGRCLLASQKIVEGTLVYREKTKAMIGYGDHICANCSNTVKNGFHDEFHPYAVYCSSVCRDLFTSRRDFELPVAGVISDIAITSNCDEQLLRMILRILSWASVEYSDEQGTEDSLLIDDGVSLQATYQGFLTLEPHIELQTTEWSESVKNAIEKMLPLISTSGSALCGTAATTADILKIASRINTNAYGCQKSDGSNTYIGFGIFPVIGMTINHDCHPNCCYTFIDGHLECRVIRTVLKEEELTVNYIDLIETFQNRRKELTQKRHFECTCQRCMGSLVYWNRQSAASSRAAAADLDLAEYDVSIASGYPDALLAGTFCERCGPAAVIPYPVLQPTEDTPSDADNMSVACSQCGFRVTTANVQQLLADAVAQLEAHMREASVWKSSSPMQAAAALEKWLRAFDPLASSTFGSGQQTVNSVASRRHGGLKLHPCHKLIMEANIAISNYFDAAGDLTRSVGCLRRAVATVELVVTSHFPELASLRFELAQKIQKLSHKSGLAAKAKQALVREAADLLAKTKASRIIAFGEEHPINSIQTAL